MSGSMPFLTHLQKRQKSHAKRLALPIIVLMALALISWPVRQAMFARYTQQAQAPSTQAGSLFTTGSWKARDLDLLYTVAFSRAEQPNGPLVVYRVSGADLHAVTPVFVKQRSSLLQTPVFFPSP